MKRLKSIAFTLLLVVALGGAPATLAEDDTQPLTGVLAALADWLQTLLGTPGEPATDLGTEPEQNEIGLYIIPGG